MGITRSRSNTVANSAVQQMKRNISGPISIGSAAARASENELAKRWLLRIGVVVTFFILPAVVYLAVSISSLQTALQDSNQQQQLLLSELHQTSKHSSVRRDTSRLPARTQYEHQQVVVLTTKLGDIRIVLRPDLSKESVEYIKETVNTGCKRCTLYRAEAPGVLQGAMEGNFTDASKTPKGPCPAGYENFQNPCHDSSDESCGCHGPVMSHGMVAWAAGFTGPDFFINNYPHDRATWWGTTHTSFGEIQDAKSFAVIEEIWKLPTHKIQNLRNILDEILQFSMRMETIDVVVTAS